MMILIMMHRQFEHEELSEKMEELSEKMKEIIYIYLLIRENWKKAKNFAVFHHLMYLD